MLKLGKISIPKRHGTRPFAWFKKWYDLMLSGKVKETAEEVYILLGGKLVGYKPKKKEKVNAPEK